MQKRTTRRCHMKINIAVILLPYWILQVLKRPPTCIGLKVPLLSLIMIIHVSYVQNFTVDTRPKLWPIWFYHRVMSPKDAERNANSVDPDQTLHCLPRLVRKLRITTVIYHFIVMVTNSTIKKGGARWLSGRVSDSGARGPGFETYLRRVVSLSKTLYSPKVLVNYPGSDGSVPTWLKNCWLGR